ncbi:hypothetical protein PHPALM_28393 [Phytophthora palmivora]|uniref:Uncharacterized protein n=1 Tax=Phytophthora palmivora TaxID=4796 RepID=A0A2P4XA78_9STRA|nr:hypothetical protein PHPALM_28393 [Phytophthora palmivora]
MVTATTTTRRSSQKSTLASPQKLNYVMLSQVFNATDIIGTDNLLLRRAALVKLQRPHFKVSGVVWQDSQQEALTWGDVLLRPTHNNMYIIP